MNRFKNEIVNRSSWFDRHEFDRLTWSDRKSRQTIDKPVKRSNFVDQIAVDLITSISPRFHFLIDSRRSNRHWFLIICRSNRCRSISVFIFRSTHVDRIHTFQFYQAEKKRWRFWREIARNQNRREKCIKITHRHKERPSAISIWLCWKAFDFWIPITPQLLTYLLTVCLTTCWALLSANKPKFGDLVWYLTSLESYQPSNG